MMASTLEIGSRAEQAAADYLSANGFTLCHRNWRSGRYELDIVAEKGDTLHIVEVKCRHFGSLTSPEDAATAVKFRSLQKAAVAYIETYKIELEVQFDLISVGYGEKGMKIKYIPNAFTPAW